MEGKIRGALGRMKQNIQNLIMGLLFAVGLLIAGSDGEWFPWINGVGLFMLALVTCFANLAHRCAPWR